MDRNLDGVYFRVKRNGKWEGVCFSDLTEEERENVLKDKSTEFLKGLCFHLADSLKTLGDQWNIMRV